MRKLNKELDCNDFVNFFYYNERTFKELENLQDDDLITRLELKKILKVNIEYFLYANKKYYKRKLYPVLLQDFIERHSYKNLANKVFIRGKNLHHFWEFKKWYDDLKTVRNKKNEYKKTMLLYYGNPSETTKECIENQYNCINCRNNYVCTKYKVKITQKQLAKMMSLLFPMPKNN